MNCWVATGGVETPPGHCHASAVHAPSSCLLVFERPVLSDIDAIADVRLPQPPVSGLVDGNLDCVHVSSRGQKKVHGRGLISASAHDSPHVAVVVPRTPLCSTEQSTIAQLFDLVKA